MRVTDLLEPTASALSSRRRAPLVRLVESFIDESECAVLRARIDSLSPAPAPITTRAGAVMRPDVRNNERVMFDDADLADDWFGRAAGVLPRVLRGDSPRTTHVEGARWQLAGLNERFRGYRYRPGQRFAPHFDGSFARSPDEISAITFIVYLDEGCAGGETSLLDYGVSVRPRRGSLFMFDHHVLHEGALVTAGEKYVLRSDVMYRLESGIERSSD
jgi:hypothetical protein